MVHCSHLIDTHQSTFTQKQPPVRPSRWRRSTFGHIGQSRSISEKPLHSPAPRNRRPIELNSFTMFHCNFNELGINHFQIKTMTSLRNWPSGTQLDCKSCWRFAAFGPTSRLTCRPTLGRAQSWIPLRTCGIWGLSEKMEIAVTFDEFYVGLKMQ